MGTPKGPFAIRCGEENRPGRSPLAPTTPSADPPRSVPIAPCQGSKCLKTLKTARPAIGGSWHGLGIGATFAGGQRRIHGRQHLHATGLARLHLLGPIFAIFAGL